MTGIQGFGLNAFCVCNSKLKFICRGFAVIVKTMCMCVMLCVYTCIMGCFFHVYMFSFKNRKLVLCSYYVKQKKRKKRKVKRKMSCEDSFVTKCYQKYEVIMKPQPSLVGMLIDNYLCLLCYCHISENK